MIALEVSTETNIMLRSARSWRNLLWLQENRPFSGASPLTSTYNLFHRITRRRRLVRVRPSSLPQGTCRGRAGRERAARVQKHGPCPQSRQSLVDRTHGLRCCALNKKLAVCAEERHGEDDRANRRLSEPFCELTDETRVVAWSSPRSRAPASSRSALASSTARTSDRVQLRGRHDHALGRRQPLADDIQCAHARRCKAMPE